jgi:hypothetical protein
VTLTSDAFAHRCDCTFILHSHVSCVTHHIGVLSSVAAPEGAIDPRSLSSGAIANRSQLSLAFDPHHISPAVSTPPERLRASVRALRNAVERGLSSDKTAFQPELHPLYSPPPPQRSPPSLDKVIVLFQLNLLARLVFAHATIASDVAYNVPQDSLDIAVALARKSQRPPSNHIFSRDSLAEASPRAFGSRVPVSARGHMTNSGLTQFTDEVVVYTPRTPVRVTTISECISQQYELY